MHKNSLLTPNDWHLQALREATELVGTPEYAAKMVEARRYKALAEEIERLVTLGEFYRVQADGHAEQVHWLMAAIELRKKTYESQQVSPDMRQVWSD